MEIKRNEEKNGYEIYFDAIPDAGTRESLKSAGYRWHGVKKCWYGKTAPDFLNGDEKPTARKEKKARPSLWERTRTDDLPAYGTENDVKKAIRAIIEEKKGGKNYWGYDKAAAEYFRRHLRERFPEVKFSITSGGAGYLNACDIEIKASPYEQIEKKGDPNAADWYDRRDRTINGPELAAILAYCNALHDAADADDGDHYADYGAHHDLYGNASVSYQYEQKEQTDADKDEIENFRAEQAKDEERKHKEEDERFRLYCEQMEKERKEQEEREKIRQEKEKRIEEHVKTVDLDESERVAVVGALQGIGKENTLEEVKERADRRSDAIITRKAIFTDEEIFKDFCGLFLSDFSFVSGMGGSGTEDRRVNSSEDLQRLNAEQVKKIHFYAVSCVGVYFGEELRFVVDPQGYTYARYVLILDEETKIIPASDYLNAEREKSEGQPDFYVPAPLSEQIRESGVMSGEKVTILRLDPWACIAQELHGKIVALTATKYAQYENAARVEIIPNGKRNTRYFYTHGGDEFVLYRGELPNVPESMKYSAARSETVGAVLQKVNYAGEGASEYIKSVLAYYAELGYKPAINTIPA